MPLVRILERKGEFIAEVSMRNHIPLANFVTAGVWRKTKEAAQRDAADFITRNDPGTVVNSYEARLPSGLHIPQPAPDSCGELGPFGAFWLGVALGAVLRFAVGLWVGAH